MLETRNIDRWVSQLTNDYSLDTAPKYYFLDAIAEQAKAYVSLVEKIKKLEFEFISSSRNSSPTQSSNKGWNSALREIKSFIGEI